MPSPAQKNSEVALNHRYNPTRFPVSEAKEALGLSSDATDVEAGMAIKALLEKSALLPAAMGLSDAHETVRNAVKLPEAGLFPSFTELEAQNRDKLAELLHLIRQLDSGVKRFAAFPRYSSQEQPGSPASDQKDVNAQPDANHHLSMLASSASERVFRQRTRGYFSADVVNEFLADNFVIAPNADRHQPPAPELTATLTRHGLEWRWNDHTNSWDPRKLGSRQSLFRAAPIYFEDVRAQVQRGEARFLSSEALTLIESCARLSAYLPRPLTARSVVDPDILNAQRLALYTLLHHEG